MYVWISSTFGWSFVDWCFVCRVEFVSEEWCCHVLGRVDLMLQHGCEKGMQVCCVRTHPTQIKVSYHGGLIGVHLKTWCVISLIPTEYGTHDVAGQVAATEVALSVSL